MLVAALLTRGAAAQVLDLWLQGRYTLLTSPGQLDELKRVLREKFPELPKAKVGRVINLLRFAAQQVWVRKSPGLSLDPDDDWILAVALEGRADVLVTGDRSHLLGLKMRGLRILSVQEFLEVMA